MASLMPVNQTVVLTLDPIPEKITRLILGFLVFSVSMVSYLCNLVLVLDCHCPQKLQSADNLFGNDLYVTVCSVKQRSWFCFHE